VSTTVFEILLVEDSDADAYLFRKALENAGVAVKWTIIGDGAEGMAFARREGRYAESPRPDLVLLDLNLPKNNGTEVLKAIRQSAYLAKVPVFILSSSASPRDRAEADELGVERCIIKPPDLESFFQLGAVVKDVLHARQNRESQ
jgi:two-component system, chemotaxis family, response regulator Rcp1